mmetsp:Transcript_2589/g.5604  ORF Transcript_2589/g.5604 Transcript_2589/m.5604 type:complete len:103 (+) Transcript_2589:770-1078(+)
MILNAVKKTKASQGAFKFRLFRVFFATTIVLSSLENNVAFKQQFICLQMKKEISQRKTTSNIRQYQQEGSTSASKQGKFETCVWYNHHRTTIEPNRLFRTRH